MTGQVNTQAVLDRRDAFIHHLDDSGLVQWLEGIGAELVRGVGRLAGPRVVEVTGERGETHTLRANEAVVITTVSRPASPPVDGLADISTWDSRQVTTTDHIPDRLIVLGGGVAGCEMAQAHRRLGATEVTIVEMAERILSPYEPWTGELLAEQFREEGIAVRTGIEAERVSRDGDNGPVTLDLGDGEAVTADEMLVATGRAPNTDDIGLTAVGLEPGTTVEVDDRLRVRDASGDWLYAAGDVNGRAQLTHQGKYQGRLIGDNIVGADRVASADHTAIPQVVFTDPEVAAVGTTEQQAVDAGIDVKTVSYDLRGIAGAGLAGGGKGKAQLVIDQQRRVITGATFVGPHVGEILHAATIAVVGEVPLESLWDAVPAFPTISEVWLRLLEADRGIL